MSVNDEFDWGLGEETPAEPKEAKSKKAKKLDPEEDRANWPTIQIAFEDAKPNFEFIGVAGTMKDGRPFSHQLRVQRGVDVQVPPSVVNMLRSTKQAHYHQKADAQTGRMELVRTDRPPLPWQLIDKGAYC